MLTDEQFTILAKQYMNTIYRVAYGSLKDSHDANDVTQNVLIKLYKTDKEFDSDSHLKNWLIRVTINECRMLFRSPWRKHESIEDYAQTLGFEQKDYSDLFQAVMRLPAKYRIPLILFYLEGYTTSETADLMHLSVNTVSTRLRRAKEQLKDYLEE